VQHLGFIPLDVLISPRGGARHFHLGGPLEGPVLQQGELSMVCVGLSEKDLKNFWGEGTGGARQNFGRAVDPPGTPLAPPLISPIVQQTLLKNLPEF